MHHKTHQNISQYQVALRQEQWLAISARFEKLPRTLLSMQTSYPSEAN
jgi:hypothetical protein